MKYLEKNIFDCRNHEDYILNNGGLSRMRELRAKELLLFKEDN